MGRITTVIFDMYETLVHNNTGLWIDAFGEICRAQGLDVDPELLYKEWKTLEMGFRKDRLDLEEPEKSPPFQTYEQAWRDCFSGVFSRLGLSADAAKAAKDAVRDMGRREPYLDAVEALPAVQASWRTAVLSNADDAYLFPLLERLGWRFDAVLSSEGARAYKPLPSAFEQIVAMLGIRAGEAVYVGDTLFDDVLGAHRVGMSTVWINRNRAPTEPSPPTPDYEIRSLKELPGILQDIC